MNFKLSLRWWRHRSFIYCVRWWDDERHLFIVSDSDTFCAVKHNFQYWHVYWIFLKACDKWRHIVTYARRLLFRIFFFFFCVKKSLNYTFLQPSNKEFIFFSCSHFTHTHNTQPVIDKLMKIIFFQLYFSSFSRPALSYCSNIFGIYYDWHVSEWLTRLDVNVVHMLNGVDYIVYVMDFIFRVPLSKVFQF